MELFRILLGTSTLLCSLVAGLVFTFAVVIMPGLRSLGNHDFLRAFQVIDRVIQNGQPLFVLVWLGSALVTIASTAFGVFKLEGFDRLLIIAAAATYLLAVQLPTITINVPLNNALQRQELAGLDEPTLLEARRSFERRWVRWNLIRTIAAVVTCILLIVVQHRV